MSQIFGKTFFWKLSFSNFSQEKKCCFYSFSQYAMPRLTCDPFWPFRPLVVFPHRQHPITDPLLARILRQHRRTSDPLPARILRQHPITDPLQARILRQHRRTSDRPQVRISRQHRPTMCHRLRRTTGLWTSTSRALDPIRPSLPTDRPRPNLAPLRECARATSA